MKKVLFILSFIAVAGSVMAQSNYYHQVGDTVRGKSPIYHYDWWPSLNAIGHTDSVIGTFGGFGYMKHTTNTPLKVIGVASTVTRLYSQTDSSYEDLDSAIDGTLYYVLFDATAGGLVERARVCWSDDYMTHPKRYMVLPRRGGAFSCDQMLDLTAIVPLREYYFDSAITVTDSFYLGCATTDPVITDFNSFSYIASHMWDYCTYAVSVVDMDTLDATLKPCGTHVPEFTYYDSSILDNSWHYYTRKKFQLIFPIIEVDTTCDKPEEPQVAYRDSLRVRVEWTDTNNLRWEVSRTTPGGNPETGYITPTTNPYIEYSDIDDDSVYHVYVRGYCERWDSWSDWSAPCLIDSIPTPIGITAIETADFTLSPNPTKSMVTLKCTETLQGSVEIIDMQGKSWCRKALAGPLTELDVSALPAGAYLVRIATEKGTSTKKLSIE